MFPRSLYTVKKQIVIQKTSTPTGVLANSIDLAKPWLTISTANVQRFDKKVVIFSDHFYTLRVDFERERIFEDLKKLKKENFRILLLSCDDNSKLVDWDAKKIPKRYYLEVEKISAEYIYNLAKKLYGIASDKIFILDHFGINELGKNAHKDEIIIGEFKSNPSIVKRLITNIKKTSYKVVFEPNESKLISDLELDKIEKVSFYTLAVSQYSIDDFSSLMLSFDKRSWENLFNFSNYGIKFTKHELHKLLASSKITSLNIQLNKNFGGFEKAGIDKYLKRL